MLLAVTTAAKANKGQAKRTQRTAQVTGDTHIPVANLALLLTVVSAILANIYLHHVLDVWFEDTVRKHCIGQVYYCRYADDFDCAFENAKDANRFYEALRQLAINNPPVLLAQKHKNR